jgi:2-methylcitrate dehydratase PrpD
VCKLLKFDTRHTVDALAIASSCSGGLSEYTETGGMVKRVHAGFAATNGLRAALLAKNGITGPHSALEGKKGLCQAFSDSYSVDELTRGLGKEFRIVLTGNKPYCCCAAQHAAIDAVSEMMQGYLITPENIDKILVRQKAREVGTIGNIVEPHDIISAQFSGRFGIALRLVKGGNGFRDYSEENLSDRRIKNLVHRIDYETDDELEKINPSGAPASVKVQSKEGNVYERTVQFAKGTVQNPMTRDELENKFRGLAGGVLTKDHYEEIISLVEELEIVDDLCTLGSLLVCR